MRSISRRRFALTAASTSLATALPFQRLRAQSKKSVSIAIQFGTSHLATNVADKLRLFAKHAALNGIADAAVIGVPDGYRGETAKAFAAVAAILWAIWRGLARRRASWLQRQRRQPGHWHA